MNWKHIEAMCKTSKFGVMPINYADVDGKRILTEGRIAFVFNGEFPFDTAKAMQHEGVAVLWKKYADLPPSPAEMGACYSAGKLTYRKLGEVHVAEQYVRCFGMDAQWTSQGLRNPVLVHREGVLVAVVMPMRDCSEKEPCTPTDEQVFSPYACEANGWYLQTKEDQIDQIKRAERDVSNARIAVEEADADLEEAERALRLLHKSLGAAK